MSTPSPAAAASPATAHHKDSIVKVALASLTGTTLEFYDHFIYGSAAALFFPVLFFPQGDPFIALLMSLASYGIAFFARPVGAAIFGHYGDRIGRKRILIITLLMMGISTFLIGLLPTYGQIGALAPVLLVALRFCQGFALGGEWGGAALIVNEFDPKGKRRGFYGSLVQVASPIGLLMANGILALITWAVSKEALFSWGWRIPFITSSILVLLGLYMRRTLEESPVFEKLEKSNKEVKAPIVDILKHHRKPLFIALGTRVGSDICWYVFSLFMLVYLPKYLDISSSVAFFAVIGGAVAQVIGIPLFGVFTDRWGRRPVLLFGAIGAFLWGFAFFLLGETRDPTLLVLAAFVGMFLHAALWAPLASFIPELFPANVRCTGASLGFQIPSLLGGALAPVICTTLIARDSSGMSVAVYMGVFLLLIVVSVLAARETTHETVDHVE